MALFWGKDWEVSLINYSHHHIDALVTGNDSFYLTLFYGDPVVGGRVCSWHLLRKLKKEGSEPWLVMGDFNEVLDIEEVHGKRKRPNWQISNFKVCLNFCGLRDFKMTGDWYTYSNKRIGDEEVKARLDRFVANEGWISKFGRPQIKKAFAMTSDHALIVLETNRSMCKRRSLIERFEPMWLSHGGCRQEVAKNWNTLGGGCLLQDKIKNCLKGLVSWSKKDFGNVGRRIKGIKEEIMTIRNERLSQVSRKREAELERNLDEWLAREEVYWR